MPPTREAMTGVPCASASSSTSPNASVLAREHEDPGLLEGRRYEPLVLDISHETDPGAQPQFPDPTFDRRPHPPVRANQHERRGRIMLAERPEALEERKESLVRGQSADEEHERSGDSEGLGKGGTGSGARIGE